MVRTLLMMLALSVTARAEEGIRVAWEAEPRTIDPRFAVDANSQYLENLLHCALIDFDQDGRAIADLAEAWTWRSPTLLSIKLKPYAAFSDGSKVTATDVKATYEAIKQENTKQPSPRRGAFNKLKSIHIDGDHDLRFELTEPDATFLLNLVVGILPAKTVQNSAMLTTEASVPGCGPFELKSFSNTQIALAANSRYKLEAAPKSPTIIIKIVKDETTRYAKLRAGEIDIVQNAISRDKLRDIGKKNPHLKVMHRPGINTVYLGFNMRDKLVSKLAVRQAIAYAIDREKIIKYALNGLATPATTLLPPNDPYHSKSLASPTLDLAKAKKLLDDAGYPDPDGDGRKPRFVLSYKTTTDQTRIIVAKAIAADLKKIGIDVTVETLEWGRFKADVEAGKVQMWSLQWIGFKDPDIFRFAFATESFPPNGGNRGFYSNPALDQLLDTGRKEIDTDRRIATYQQVQSIVNTEMPYVFLWHEEIFAAVNKSVEDFELYADGRFASLQRAYRQ